MPFAGKVFVSPITPAVPYLAIGRAWHAARFERRTCRVALERIIAAYQLPEDYFDLDELDRGGLVATRALLSGFHADRKKSYVCRIHTAKRALTFEVGADALVAIAQLVRTAIYLDSPNELRHAFGDDVEPALIQILIDALVEEAPYGYWPALPGAGIQRREHASLVIQTNESCVVTDPQCLSAGWTTNDGRYPGDPAHALAASVLITHSHADHFHLPSMMRWLDEGTRAVVPAVPAPSIVAEDMATMARAAFPDPQVAVPAWWSSVSIGDIDVQVLPFYGEQPTRRLPAAAPELQNWGNCYRLDLPDYSIAVLADSGADARGDMTEVLRRSAEDRGPIDILVSCCLDFPEAINEGLPHYLLLVPFAELERLARERESITLGPSGVVDACAAARARFFMPYAHGYSGVRQHPRSDSAATETWLLARIASALAERSVGTEVVPWLPGQFMTWEDGRPTVRSG